ncbi:unnamed protein product [Didymodactylos carnosus]|uniref:Uncharacterized protein n=1 Tax=Didymodactylos carnosus TaxID=1234261 RepID=A0A813SEN9_9BILA|nr:unnamed protein product [Didymodactylos carnosus]CAF3584400.1 unnamed protein product [Didymodactylos carnosus]
MVEDDIGASGSEIENSSSEDGDEEDLVDNCWGDETDDQGHYSEDNLSNEDDDEYVLSRDLSQTQRATFSDIRPSESTHTMSTTLLIIRP